MCGWIWICHEDFQAPLDVLNQAEIAAVNRGAVEALWNVAKHSKASNLYVESRRVSRTLIVCTRDNGCAFDPQKPPSGMDLQYIGQRTEEVDASLDTISTP